MPIMQNVQYAPCDGFSHITKHIKKEKGSTMRGQSENLVIVWSLDKNKTSKCSEKLPQISINYATIK